MSYSHCTRDLRVELAALLKAGQKHQDIALQLCKHRSTLWRERKRNSCANGSYDVRTAEPLARKRRIQGKKQGDKLHRDTSLQRYVVSRLKKYWSPQQIAGRLKFIHGYSLLCHETIYRYIYFQAPELQKYLRQKKGKYRRRHGTSLRVQKRKQQEMKRRIDERPTLIEERSRIGDWEGDTIVGKEKIQRILTHVDRKSGILLADKVMRSTAKEIETLTIERFRKMPRKKCLTVTYDNGLEFSSYEFIERGTRMTVYFAYPYHSWERGTNENTNGLLRQFFPKGSSFASITQEDIDRAVSLINHRPRKRHQYRTPSEVFRECCTST